MALASACLAFARRALSRKSSAPKSILQGKEVDLLFECLTLQHLAVFTSESDAIARLDQRTIGVLFSSFGIRDSLTSIADAGVFIPVTTHA